MDNIKINVDEYSEYGLGDIYYGLISFISDYVTRNYNPMDILQNGNSQYALAVTTMKSDLKELLDYLKTVDEVYLPSLNRIVRISSLNIDEQTALEQRCKEYLILKLNNTLNAEKESNMSSKSK